MTDEPAPPATAASPDDNTLRPAPADRPEGFAATDRQRARSEPIPPGLTGPAVVTGGARAATERIGVAHVGVGE